MCEGTTYEMASSHVQRMKLYFLSIFFEKRQSSPLTLSGWTRWSRLEIDSTLQHPLYISYCKTTYSSSSFKLKCLKGQEINSIEKKKSRIRETTNISTDADNSTNNSFPEEKKLKNSIRNDSPFLGATSRSTNAPVEHPSCVDHSQEQLLVF